MVRRASVDQLDSLVAGIVECHLATALVSSAKGGRSLRFLRAALEQLLGKGVHRIGLGELKDVKVVKKKVKKEVKKKVKKEVKGSRFVLALSIPARMITTLAGRRLLMSCCSVSWISRFRLQGR